MITGVLYSLWVITQLPVMKDRSARKQENNGIKGKTTTTNTHTHKTKKKPINLI